MTDFERIRLVILGCAGVGKSCIAKRFLFKTYNDKYRATVEDLYNREYKMGGVTLKVDILDTSGDMQFPAMRRLSIATAHAFLLVYASTSSASFSAIKQCFEEIREQRGDFQEIPMVIAGNKHDLAATHREVPIEDVSEWAFCELPKLRVKVLECSAKSDFNIKELFKTLLTLSRIIPPTVQNNAKELKRRSSAHINMESSSNSMSGASFGPDKPNQPCFNTPPAEPISGMNKFKQRSRSVIRRSSRKTKQQIQNASEDECQVQ